MLRFKLPVGLVGALLTAFLLSSPANASIVQGLELDELVGQSERIVLGEVLFSESFQRSDGTLGTWHRIRVERDVRGNALGEREIIVETLGGRIGKIGMRVEGEPSFEVGERVVVFVEGGGAYSAFRPVGMAQGVMRVRVEQGIETVHQSREGLLLLRRNADGAWEKSRGAVPEKERLDTFLSKLELLVQQRAGGNDE